MPLLSTRTPLVPVFVPALLVLALAVAYSGCGGTSAPDRGNDPWVFRSVVDLQPRMVTLALRDDFWVSYNAGTTSLYRAWPGGMDFAGPVYNQAHGPQPTTVGPAYLQNEVDDPWRVRLGGQDLAPTVRYLGHRFDGHHAVLSYELDLGDGRVVEVHETPRYEEDGSGNPGIARVFSTTNVPDGATVVLRMTTSTTSAGAPPAEVAEHELVSNGETRVAFHFASADVPPFRPGGEEAEVTGWALAEQHNCQICHNVDAQTVGPSFTMIAERYNFTSYNVDRLARKVIAGGSGEWGATVMTPHPALPLDEARELVRYILSLDGESEDTGPAIAGPALTEDTSNDDARGLVVNVWRAQGDIPGMLDPTEAQKPVYSGVVPQLNFSGLAFAPFEENFYIEARGTLTVEQPGNYVFRVISDDGGILYLNGRELVNNDGFHGPDPKDGEVQLDAGDYPIEVRYFQGGGGRTLSVQWVKHGDQGFSVIPAEAFTYDASDMRESAPFEEAVPRVKGIPGDQLPVLGVHPSFTLETIRPDGFEPMVGGLDVMDDGRVVVSTWDPEGAVYIVSNIPDAVDTDEARQRISVKKIASGLAEPLGVKVVDGEIYVLQKHELTRLIDHDGDEVIDEYRTLVNGWGATPNFHEFAFGLEYAGGYFYGTLATAILPGGASADPQNPDRGRVIKMDPATGGYEFVAQGLRTPNGIGVGADGELFVADNQGDWLPSSKILHISEGAFLGSRSVDFEGTAGQTEKPPVVWLPQNEIGNSPSTPAILNVGPYKNQMIHGEVTHGGIKRVFVEQVDGVYQGALFRFTQGIEAGVNRIAWGPDGRLYIGGIGNPGNWGHTGGNWFGLQRLSYTGGSVFEMLAVRVKSNGLEVEFTEPLSPGDGFNRGAYDVQQWRYVPTEEYGGPKVDLEDLRVASVHVAEDRRRVFLEIPGLREGHVVYLRLREPWISAEGNGLWSREMWYTLNRIPQNEPGFRSGLQPLPAVANSLTQAEIDAGWELLFDGQTLDGWRNYNSDTIGPAWRVADGALTLGGELDEWQTVGGGDIITDRTFENYDLRLEWRIAPGGNSGIIYNVVEDEKYEYVWETGPEMQVLDNDGHPDGAIASHRAGELYDLIALPYEPTVPVGEWNSVRIVQRDGLVEHWLNGHMLLRVQIGSQEWSDLVSASKFIEMPDFGKATSGHIALQDHGDRVWYRNIKVREL